MRALAMLSILCAACGTGPLPAARIDLDPSSLCEGDAGQAVVLSASRSVDADGADDRLSFAWTVSLEPTETLRGGADEEEWVVRFDARHAVRIDLAVTDEDGRVGTREKLLGLVRTQLLPCDAGCPAHQVCVPVGGSPACVDDRGCNDDAECGCLRCRIDDRGDPRCLP